MRRNFVFVTLFGLALTACDTQGLHPLGARRDTLVPCSGETSTWIRSTAERTEVLVLGSASPTAIIDPVTPVCFAYGWVEHDSSTFLEAGSYYVGVGGVGEALHNDEYTFNYDPTTAILSRDGATKDHATVPTVEPITITSPDADHVVVTYEGETHRYTSIAAVIEDLDPTTQSGAEDIFRLYNLPLFTSQVRLNGFGSGSMTQYVLTTPARFYGLIRNEFTVQVAQLSPPHTTIAYFQFEDLTGITIDGEQKSLVSISGAGPMSGTLNFVMLGRPLGGGVPNPVIRGSIDYADIEIAKGVAAGGTYALDVDYTGPIPPYSISYMLATDIDLRGVLPVTTP